MNIFHLDVFLLVGGTESNRNTCWSLVCLAGMREMEQRQLPGACKIPGGTNHSGPPTFEGEPCWQSFSSWFYSSLLLLPHYLSLCTLVTPTTPIHFSQLQQLLSGL